MDVQGNRQEMVGSAPRLRRRTGANARPDVPGAQASQGPLKEQTRGVSQRMLAAAGREGCGNGKRKARRAAGSRWFPAVVALSSWSLWRNAADFWGNG